MLLENQIRSRSGVIASLSDRRMRTYVVVVITAASASQTLLFSFRYPARVVTDWHAVGAGSLPLKNRSGVTPMSDRKSAVR